MALLDLLGRRWTLRVMWELRDERVLTFRALQEACDGMSSSVLRDRLAELVGARIVERTADGYALTADGRDLRDHLTPLDAWAKRWAGRS